MFILFKKKKRIYTDSGRCMRPLFIVENAKNKKLCINKENLRTITKQNLQERQFS
jgi:hypothetical protein